MGRGVVMAEQRLMVRLWLFMALVAVCLNSASSQTPKAPPSSARLTVRQLPDGTLELRRGPRSSVTIKTIAEATPPSASTADLTIDLSSIDMTPFKNMYRLWSEVPLYFESNQLVICDANHDGRPEIYGMFHDYNTPDPGYSRIYEFNGDSGFVMVHQYPDSLYGALTAADFAGNGRLSVVYESKFTNFNIETQPTTNSLPATETLSYNFGGQPYNTTAYDLTGDGRPELIYWMLGWHNGPTYCQPGAIYVEEYDSSKNAFQVLYCNKPERGSTEGFAFGDFDQDGKQNFATGSIDGYLYIYEHQADGSFSLVSPGYIGVNNAYLLAFTHDMDGNGKPELWVGGDQFQSGVGVTKIFVYEASGDNTYQLVYTIEIVGIFSFYAFNMVAADVDGDGKDELLLCIDEHVLILKSNGIHSYYLWYMRTNELADAGLNSEILGATVFDFGNDGWPEILVTMAQEDPTNLDQGRYFTRVYKSNVTTGIRLETPKIPGEYVLEQNYPNPFNGGTTIRYGLPKNSTVTINVYDVLGREVRNLRNTKDQVGMHEVRWDARDDEGVDLSSGVYLICLRANGFTKTIKVLLLR